MKNTIEPTIPTIRGPATTIAWVALFLVSCTRATAIGAAPESDKNRTFYVDSEHGRDGNDGRSEDTAWCSLDVVNTADLKPGDTVRFRCGRAWRGSLVPASGDEDAEVVYTSCGDGPKPLILGSLPRGRPEDWTRVRENLWATLPMEYALKEQILDLRQSEWRRHQEAGADVGLSDEEAPEGQIFKFVCKNSGQASNHVQVWGPELAVEEDACLVMTFRARSSKPFRLPHMSICQGSSPWTGFATARALDREIGPQWEVFQSVFEVSKSSEQGRLHVNLGAVLPPDATFEFQPQSLHAATASVVDPLAVDVGNVIFDHGARCGWKKWSVDQLQNPYDYYYDRSSWRVFLNSKVNPATAHKSIEFALKRHVVNQGGAHHVIYDGLAVKYGAAHGFGGGGTHHLVIRNCDLAYIGGGHQLTRPGGTPVRYGNAIEFWGAAHDNLVEGCRIWEVYDAALTNQGRGPSSKQVNITYRNNVIWNCEYSFEYWNNPETALTQNIRFLNNTCASAGTVWSHAQRPDQNGSHLMFYSNTAVTSGIEVKYNVFSGVTEWGSRYSSGWKPLPDMDHNLWFTTEGVMVNWFGKTIGSFDDYRNTTGLDAHSRFADPEFLDPAVHDYRLAPDSPARAIRPDGGPVGAESLFSATIMNPREPYHEPSHPSP
ncbi:hypothetical protein ACFL5Q_00985 [Planctomycetota bacterium]